MLNIKKGLWVIIDCYNYKNAGHVLGDEVFAVWQSLSVFGLQNENFNIITSNNYRHKQLYKCITDNLFSRKDFDGKKILFEKVLIGVTRNGYAVGHQLGPYIFPNWRRLSSRASYLPPFQDVCESFRKHSYKKLNIDEDLLHNRSIVILDKNISSSEHKSVLHEIDNLIALIKDQHKSHDVRKVCWEGMNIRDQVKEMSRADLVISLPGADMNNCIFLNPKSSIIAPDRYVYVGNEKPLKKEGSNEIDIWLKFTHKCIMISDVSAVLEGNIVYVKINDKNNLLSTIKDCIDS